MFRTVVLGREVRLASIYLSFSGISAHVRHCAATGAFR